MAQIRFDSLEIRQYDITAFPSRMKNSSGKFPVCHFCTELAPFIAIGILDCDIPFHESVCQRHKEECETAFKNNLQLPKFAVTQAPTTIQGDTPMAAETVQDLLKKKDGEAKPSSKKVASPKKSAKVADKKPAKAVSKEPKATSESLFKPVLQKGGLTIEAFVAKAIQNELKGRVSRPAPLLAQKVLSHAKSKWGVKVDDKGNILGKK